MAESLWALRQKVERLMGEAITGTPSGFLTVNTFGCPSLGVYEDDYFNDWQGRFYSGTHKDSSFVVTDFTQVGGVCEFSPGLAVKVDVTDLFELIPPDFSAVEINNAINLSISMVDQEALQDKVDTSIEIAASTYEYAIPSDFLYISAIYQEESTAGLYIPSTGRIDIRHWGVLHGNPAKLWFDSNYVSLITGRHLRLVGQKRSSQLTVDAGTCNIPPVFLVYQAKAILHQSRVRGSGTEFENHETQMKLAQAIADRERRHVKVKGWGHKVEY